MLAITALMEGSANAACKSLALLAGGAPITRVVGYSTGTSPNSSLSLSSPSSKGSGNRPGRPADGDTTATASPGPGLGGYRNTRVILRSREAKTGPLRSAFSRQSGFIPCTLGAMESWSIARALASGTVPADRINDHFLAVLRMVRVSRIPFGIMIVNF
jgi:hypothetical protein